jgi:hypothetical protein
LEIISIQIALSSKSRTNLDKAVCCSFRSARTEKLGPQGLTDGEICTGRSTRSFALLISPWWRADMSSRLHHGGTASQNGQRIGSRRIDTRGFMAISIASFGWATVVVTLYSRCWIIENIIESFNHVMAECKKLEGGGDFLMMPETDREHSSRLAGTYDKYFRGKHPGWACNPSQNIISVLAQPIRV